MQQRINRGINDVLVISAKCDELRRWRMGIGNSLENAGIILNPADPEIQITDLSRSDFVANFADTKRAKNSVSDMKKTMQERIAELLPQAKLGETSHLGMIEVTDNAAYSGMIQNTSTDYGRTRVITLTVQALTVIKNRTMFAILKAPFEGPSTIETALEQQKGFIKALIAAN